MQSSLAVVIAVGVAGHSLNQNTVPMLINYQGKLRSPGTGAPVDDGNYDMLFRTYDVEFGGTPLSEGTYSQLNDNPTEVSNGIFILPLVSGHANKLESRIFQQGRPVAGNQDRQRDARTPAEDRQTAYSLSSIL